MLALMNIKAI